MKKALIFLFFFLLQNNSFADCTPKDLTDPAYLRSIGKENLIEHFKEPRDQDGVGWCGAYASADSLSFAVGEPVSAIDVTINHYANNSSGNTPLKNLDGISPNSASHVAEINGYCPESVIPSNQTSSSNLGHYALSELMESFQKLSEDFKAKGKPKDYCVKCVNDAYEKVIMPALPGVTTDMVREVLIKNQGESLSSLRDLLTKLCTGQRKKIKSTIDGYNKNILGAKKIYTLLNEALDNDSMPSVGINTSAFARPGTISGGDQDHEVVVVAKRLGANGKCEYMLRNSWGRSCSYYKDSIASKCDPSKGSFWLNQDEIQNSVQDIIVYKNIPSAKKISVADNKADNKKVILSSHYKPDDSNSGSKSNSIFQSDNGFTTNVVNEKTINTYDSPSIHSKEITESTNNDGSLPSLIQQGLDSISNFFMNIWQAFANFFKY